MAQGTSMTFHKLLGTHSCLYGNSLGVGVKEGVLRGHPKILSKQDNILMQ